MLHLRWYLFIHQYSLVTMYQSDCYTHNIHIFFMQLQNNNCSMTYHSIVGSFYVAIFLSNVLIADYKAKLSLVKLLLKYFFFITRYSTVYLHDYVSLYIHILQN